MNRLGDAYAEVQEATLKQRALAKAAKDAQPKDKVSLKKAPWDKKEEVEEDASNDKSDDGEGLDKADPKAAKKKFKDRKDKDLDNDGDTDSSDEYLHKRRKAVGKSIAKEEVDVKSGRRKSLKAYTEEADETTPCSECDGSTENHAKDCPKNPDVEKGGSEKAVMNPKAETKAETKTENTKWTVYNRIMEKVRGDQTKNSLKAMDPEDNQSGEEKKFVDDHEKMGTADKQADKADITIAMAKNKHAIDNPMKAAPLRPGDNKQGDLKADKPEGRM